MAHDYDVIVVGGGLVGASLACALADTPLRIAVVEAVPYAAAAQPSFDDRSVALAFASRLILTALGVWPRIPAGELSPIKAIHISDRGRPGSTHLDTRDAGTEALGYVVPARALGAALIAQMQTARNIEVLAPARLTALRIEVDTAVATVAQNDEAHTLRARLIVAADGARSQVRNLLGIEARTRDYDQIAIVSNAIPGLPHKGVAYERFTASGPLAVLPHTQGRCAIVWSVTPARAQALLALDDAAFLSALQAEFGARLGRFSALGARQSYPLSLTQVAQTVHARVALIGNAAHTLHPVAGQGFNLGLRDVATLAELVRDAVGAGSDIGHTDLLARYRAWRARDTRAMTAFTDGLVRLFSNDRLPLVATRNAALLAIDLIPPAKRALLRRTMGLAGELPRTLRGLPL